MGGGGGGGGGGERDVHRSECVSLESGEVYRRIRIVNIFYLYNAVFAVRAEQNALLTWPGVVESLAEQVD